MRLTLRTLGHHGTGGAWWLVVGWLAWVVGCATTGSVARDGGLASTQSVAAGRPGTVQGGPAQDTMGKAAAAVEPAPEAAGPTAVRATPEVWVPAQTHWAQRRDPAMVMDAIAAWDAIAQGYPDARVQAKTYVARAHHWLGQRSETREQAREAFVLGEAAAREALAGLSAAPAGAWPSLKGLKGVKELKGLAGGFPCEAVYWWLANRVERWDRGAFVEWVDGYADTLAIAEAMVDMDCEVDRGGAHRLLGRLYLRAPTYELRHPDRARALFASARKAFPGHLAGAVEEAQWLAVETQDRGLFERRLRAVASASPSTDPDDVFAQQAARNLLRHMPTLFE